MEVSQEGKIMEYQTFLKNKTQYDNNKGFDIHLESINDIHFRWQAAVTRWAVKKGRAALFEDCGLGKTIQQIEWLKLIMRQTRDIDGIGLIICPLSVAEQTIKEAEMLGYNLKYVTNQDGCESLGAPMFITNYEQLHNFPSIMVKAVALDESSILKSVDGKTKNRIIERFRDTPYKLSCTATPSPNDVSELGNQVEFLGICSRKEMLSKYFVNDAQVGQWRLKGHAQEDFYKWMASWSVFIRKPSDIGFPDDGYILPKLNIESIWVDSEYIPDGEMFPVAVVKGIQGRNEIRKNTVVDKVRVLADKINTSDEQWLIFCKLNDEAAKITAALNNCVNVQGSDSPEKKNQAFWDFKNGKTKVLVTKPKIGGFGMNFQNAHHMAFVGIDDSFEAYYQCIRREYRYGQKEEVNVFIVLTNAEQMILDNVRRKEADTNKLYSEVVKSMQDFTKSELQEDKINMKDDHEIEIIETEYYTGYRGDVVETIKQVKTDSADMQIFSPPFFSLYTYSPSSRDIGNNGNDSEFWEHFSFLIPELLRVLKPGRVCAVHCMDVPSTLVNDGVIGTKDLRGAIIQEFTKYGFIWDGCAVIPKNPQAQSIRTRSKGLTFTQFEKDSTWSRPAVPDYLLKFRAPGENQTPVNNGDDGEVSRDGWIGLASGIWRINQEAEIKQAEFEALMSGVWDDVNETKTLNTTKYAGDEKHMCPLQLDTIHNAVRLWSNPGEIIHTPFGGIGSEGYQAILDGRKAILHELKPEYFGQMIKNLDHVVSEYRMDDLFKEQEIRMEK